MLKDVAAYADMGPLEATDEGEASDVMDVWKQGYLGAAIVAVVSGLLFIGTALGFLTSFTAGVLILIMFTGITV